MAQRQRRRGNRWPKRRRQCKKRRHGKHHSAGKRALERARRNSIYHERRVHRQRQGKRRKPQIRTNALYGKNVAHHRRTRHRFRRNRGWRLHDYWRLSHRHERQSGDCHRKRKLRDLLGSTRSNRHRKRRLFREQDRRIRSCGRRAYAQTQSDTCRWTFKRQSRRCGMVFVGYGRCNRKRKRWSQRRCKRQSRDNRKIRLGANQHRTQRPKQTCVNSTAHVKRCACGGTCKRDCFCKREILKRRFWKGSEFCENRRSGRTERRNRKRTCGVLRVVQFWNRFGRRVRTLRRDRRKQTRVRFRTRR